MDVRRAATLPCFPCFLTSLCAPSHFPFTLACGSQRWDLILRAWTIVMQTACWCNRLPPSTIHARTQSLTLNPANSTHSFSISHISRHHPSTYPDLWRESVDVSASCSAPSDSWCSLRCLKTNSSLMHQVLANYTGQLSGRKQPNQSSFYLEKRCCPSFTGPLPVPLELCCFSNSNFFSLFFFPPQ